jgi:hypothetical protein
MDSETLSYKRKFNQALGPIKVQLVAKRKKLTLSTWLSFVNLTRDRVLGSPHQYMGDKLPLSAVLTPTVKGHFSVLL